MDGPPDLERLAARLQDCGLYASFRHWAEGDTVFVGAEPEHCPSVEFMVFGKAMYIGRRQGGAYYAFDFVETDEEYTEDEVLEYVMRRLTASAEEYQAESRRRGSRDGCQRGTA